jgi:hypothetical protein
MPYVKRDAAGRIVSVHREAGAGEAEFLPPAHPELREFVDADGGALPEAEAGGASLEQLDRDFIRVIEDVIDLLIARHIILFTDLPAAVQDKLNRRRSVRHLAQGLDAFGDDTVPLP